MKVTVFVRGFETSEGRSVTSSRFVVSAREVYGFNQTPALPSPPRVLSAAVS